MLGGLKYLFLVITLFTSSVSFAESLVVFSAASLNGVLNDVVETYQEQHKNTDFILNFASSGTLAQQIYHGAPADIYISANQRWINLLQEKNLLYPGSTEFLFNNYLVILSSSHTQIKSFDDLLKMKRIAIANPETVPVGQYAKEALVSQNLYQTLYKKRNLVFTKDSIQNLLYSEKGEVDAAIVYHSDSLLAKKSKTIFTIPSHYHSQIVYSIALIGDSKNKHLARSFIKSLKSYEAKKTFIKHGFNFVN